MEQIKSENERVIDHFGRMTLNDFSSITGKTSASLLQEIGRINREKQVFNGRRVSPEQSWLYLKSQGMRSSFKSIAFTSLKGGVGKTISSVTLATRAQQFGFKTAILDMDSQGSSTLALDCRVTDDDPLFIDVWEDPDSVSDALVQMRERLFLLPSSLYNGMLDTELNTPDKQKQAVHSTLQSLKKNNFNLVVVDCPPSLGTAVISTIAAVDTVVIPVTSDPFSLHGLDLTISEIEAICKSFNVKKPQIRILFTKYDKREKLSGRTYDYLQKKYRQMLLPDPVPTSTQFSKALDQRASIFEIPGQYPAKKRYDKFVRNILGLSKII